MRLASCLELCLCFFYGWTEPQRMMNTLIKYKLAGWPIPTSVTVVENETGRRFQHRNVGTVAKRDCTLHQDPSGGRPQAQGCRRTRPPPHLLPSTLWPHSGTATAGKTTPRDCWTLFTLNIKTRFFAHRDGSNLSPRRDGPGCHDWCLACLTQKVWTPMRWDRWSSTVVQSRFSQGVVSLIHLDPVIQDLVR